MIQGSLKILLALGWIALTTGFGIVPLGMARADTATPGPRIALVIGNSDYGGDLGVLANPVNDARLVAKTLKDIGFDVIEVEDADQNAMKRAIADFGDKVADAGADATGLFFYAGHGLQVGGQNYLIPIHANISRERDVDIEAVSMDTVLKQMAFADSKVNIVILDACRNNPLSRGFRSATQGLAEITVKPQGSFISYSTAPGDVAADGNGANSPYSTSLAQALAKPGLDINDVFRQVRAGVMSATHGKQVPWDSSSLTAPFYFVASAPTAMVPPAAITTTGAVDPKTIELTFWEAIKDSKSADDFQAYLAKYPDGDFAGLAKIRIKQFGAEAAAPAVMPPAPVAAEDPAPASSADVELAFWNSVKDAAAKEDLEAYLKKYPAGHFSDLARSRIASIDQTRGAAVTAPLLPAPPQVQEMDATFVARQSANVRAEPGTDAKVVARFKEDDTVAVTGKVEGKDWYRVTTDAGTGYVSASLIQPADADAIADWHAAKKTGTIDALQLFLKQHPGSSFDSKAQKLLAVLQAPPKPVQPAPTPIAQQAPPAAVPVPAVAPSSSATSEASMVPTPAPAAPTGLQVGDTYEVQGRAVIGFQGGWWGNTRVVLAIERANGDGTFEGKLTGNGDLNFWEACDITVEGDNVTVRGTESSVDNKPDVLRLHRSGPDRYEGRAQSGAYMGTASMVLKSRG